MKVPAFLLKRLYVKNSLKNTDNGFCFTIKNILMDSTITSPITLAVDNKLIPPENVTLMTGDESVPADISETNTLPLPVSVEVSVSVVSSPLPPGEHTIEIACTTKEFGDIKFSITDSV